MKIEGRIIPIENAMPEVEDYFSGEKLFALAFMTLAISTWLADTSVVVRSTGDIIGVSKPNSHFHFYVSYYEGRYYIKFKTQEKEVFDIVQLEKYSEYCKEAVLYINNTPGCIADDTKVEYYDKYSFDKENQVLESAQELLISLGDLSISPVFFGVRAYNALLNAGIQHYSDLVGKTAQDLIKLKNFGIVSLTRTCDALLKLAQIDEFEETIPPIMANETGNPFDNLKERTHTLLSIVERRELCGDDESREVAANFQKNLAVIIKNLVKSATLTTERSAAILIERIFNKRKLADIVEEYELSKERIRQICIKATRRVNGKITRGKIPVEFAEAITDLISSIDDKIYFDCLFMVRESDDFLWGVLFRIVSGKQYGEELGDFLDDCKDLSPEVVQNEKPREKKRIEQRKRYYEWQKEMPNTVLLVKAGFFYTAYGPSAEVLNSVLDYKLVYTEKKLIPTTGGPDLAKIQGALEDADISYAVIIDGVIEIQFEGRKGISDIVKVEKETNELIQTIEMMQQGIDPETGEYLDSESFLLREDVQKVLKIAKAEIIRNPGAY